MIAIGWAFLAIWPIVAVIFYKKYRLPVALCATILGGNMLLPHGLGFDLPLLPPLNKYSLTMLLAVVLTAVFAGNRAQSYPVLLGWFPRNGIAMTLLVILIIGTIGSVVSNSDTVIYGWRVVPGARPYDIISEIVRTLILMLPLFLGRKVLHSSEGQRALLVTLALFTIAYTVPALYEVRMSPQLHNHIFGFTPWSFVQQMRAGGFRPVVFLASGLELAMLVACAAIAAAGMIRVAEEKERLLWVYAVVWLSVVLVLCKTFGAIIFAIIFVPLALFAKPRTQLMVVACCASLVMIYPILRAADVVPVNRITEIVQGIDPARAGSFNTRVRNEDQLLAKAQQRPLFGWGGWGRSRVYDAQGRDVSLTDGAWVGAIGRGGWFGYIATFGLLCLPALGLFFSQREKIDAVCATLALILGAALLDLIPNSGSPTIYYLVAGALLGRLEMKGDIQAEYRQEAGQPPLKRGYSRGTQVEAEKEPEFAYARTFPKKTTSAAEVVEKQSKPDNLPYRRAKSMMGYRK